MSIAACSTESPTAPTPDRVAAPAPAFGMAAPQLPTARYAVDYMEFTIDHHLAGIEMATLCVKRAVHEELRALCRESIASQQRQIELFRTWLRHWYGINYVGEIDQSARQDIRRLSQHRGVAFEDEFLTEFSNHHLRIIKESEKAVRKVHHEELRGEAQRTITNQSRQVIQMQIWDCRWYDDCRRGLIH